MEDSRQYAQAHRHSTRVTRQGRMALTDVDAQNNQPT